MIRRINSIILTLTLLLVPVVARGEDPRSSSQKGIGYSTDVLAIGLPLTAIGYTLITKDWTGLKQGAFTAAATLGSTLILKHTIYKRRPDGSDSHSFPSMHTSVSFASAAYLQRRYGWNGVFPPMPRLVMWVGAEPMPKSMIGGMLWLEPRWVPDRHISSPAPSLQNTICHLCLSLMAIFFTSVPHWIFRI